MLTVPSSGNMTAWAEAINSALKQFSDKDWNYSRILLIIKELKDFTSPYFLRIEWLNMNAKKGIADYKTILDEVTWGSRHSYELGILEIISLRLNYALSEVTSTDYWHQVRPVFRLQKKDEALAQGYTHGFWYEIQEVQGEEFENR